MNLKLVAGPAIILCTILASCDSSPSTTTQLQGDNGAVISAAATVSALAAARPSGDIPMEFRTVDFGDVARGENDFDVNAYFAVLGHLSVEPGWVIDYLYRMNGMGGGPFIYARPIDRPPYASFDEYAAATAGEVSEGAGGRDYASEYLRHIEVDDTQEGYFQLVALRTMADQFYLYWHAGYNDTAIVADAAALEEIITAAASAFENAGLPTELVKQARKLDLTPTVEFPDASTARIRLVTFSMWGGFVESTYTVSRAFPHAILAEDTTTLIEYDCGVRF